MRHDIPVAELRAELPQIEEAAAAVAACVHCGFCLPTCPTYATMGEEMDSPRGRILLMKGVLEGTLPLAEATPHLDPCLGCLACETSCPSGVRYGELIAPFRAWSEPQRGGTLGGRLRRLHRRTLLRALTGPRASALLRLGSFIRPLRALLPEALGAPLELLPSPLPRKERLPAVVPALGERRARVALLAGCVQQRIAPAVHRATLELLRQSGVEVVIPPGQSCCGALALHAGEAALARVTARRNLDALSGGAPGVEIDAIVTNAAGCGSGLRDYPLLFRGTPDEERARELARRVQDVTRFLVDLGPPELTPLPRPLRVAYHDACHLAHAQHEREAPRTLLRLVGNLELVEPADWELCCGSAGIYNLEHREVAEELGERKARNLLACDADVIATGNVGCLTQLRAHLARLGKPLPVVHTVELLAGTFTGGTQRSRAAR